MSYDKNFTSTGPVAFATISNTAVLNAGGTGTDSREYLHLQRVEVGNSSGAAASCGFGYRLPDAMWKAGFWDDSETASYVEDTTDAQDAGTSDFAISTAATNNDGYVIQSKVPFNIVNLVIGTAQNGAGTVEYNYWNGAWTTLPTIATPTVTSTGTVSLVFMKPVDWTALAAADAPVATDGLSTGYYAIRVRYTTAPATTAGLLTTLNLIDLVDFVESVSDGTSAIKEFGDFRIPYRASLVPYCSVANAANWVSVEYRQGS